MESPRFTYTIVTPADTHETASSTMDPTEAMAAWDGHVDTRTGKPLPKAAEPSELTKLRNALGGPFKKMAGLVGAASAPVPDTGDGSKIAPEDDPTILKKIADGLSDLSYLGADNAKTLLDIQKEKMLGGYTDDKTYLMEGLVRTAAALPDGSQLREKLTNTFVTQLWNDLQHPPQSYLGPKFQYRSADGSNNSLIHPQLGAAGTPYARTVKPSMMQTPARPDAGVVFDSVMTRKHAELHPNRISSMLFYVASIIIHDCFRTEHTEDGLDSNSLTSSYLDLAPLYGSNQEEQDRMRTKKDGKIHPDCFSENRLLFFPPGVGALLVMFNRFHNHVVENLATINELGRFTKPSADPPKPTGVKDDDDKAAAKFKASWDKYDNDLFQTGRLITCGLYVNIILIDYVRTILDLNRTDSNWQLNPRAEVKDLALGVGNQVSAEFNLVYRWHSTVSDRDEKWTNEIMEEVFGKDYGPAAEAERLRDWSRFRCIHSNLSESHSQSCTFQRPAIEFVNSLLWSMPKRKAEKGVTRKVSRGRLGQCRRSETLCRRSQTVLGSDSTCIAFTDASRPAGESVGDVAAVAVGGNTLPQITTRVEGAGVVHAGGLVELLGAISFRSV